MVLRSASGTRSVGAKDFFTGVLSTAAEADELLVEVRVPQAPAGQGAAFHEVSPRKGDFAYVAWAPRSRSTAAPVLARGSSAPAWATGPTGRAPPRTG